jgi:hypothetical protein
MRDDRVVGIYYEYFFKIRIAPSCRECLSEFGVQGINCQTIENNAVSYLEIFPNPAMPAISAHRLPSAVTPVIFSNDDFDSIAHTCIGSHSPCAAPNGLCFDLKFFQVGCVFS